MSGGGQSGNVAPGSPRPCCFVSRKTVEDDVDLRRRTQNDEILQKGKGVLDSVVNDGLAANCAGRSVQRRVQGEPSRWRYSSARSSVQPAFCWWPQESVPAASGGTTEARCPG